MEFEVKSENKTEHAFQPQRLCKFFFWSRLKKHSKKHFLLFFLLSNDGLRHRCDIVTSVMEFYSKKQNKTEHAFQPQRLCSQLHFCAWGCKCCKKHFLLFYLLSNDNLRRCCNNVTSVMEFEVKSENKTEHAFQHHRLCKCNIILELHWTGHMSFLTG